MDHRLGRTVRVFLVVLATMGLYRLAVVPWVEPRSGEAAATVAMTPEEAAAIRARADGRLAALGDVFPPGAWERDDPIVLESRQMRLLFKEYHTLPDGRVNLVPCTLALLPDRTRGASGGRTLVLRAPQGAVLEFDEPLDLQRGRLAKLVGGSLRGQVTIRGTPSAPGLEDDIEIVTRDIALDQLEVRSVETVQFRYGRSSGSGRGLVARLTPRGEGSDHGPNIGGVDLIRLERDVRMRLEGVGGRLLPGQPAPSQQAASPPVLVNCRGGLSYNVSANVVTLEDHVDVVRTGDGSATDHLACDLLAIVLERQAHGEVRDGGEDATSASPRRGLEPVEIQAKGSPVVVTSSGAGVEARAARLGYEIATRRILLDGEEPVSLAVRGSEMEARKIDYCPGPPGDPGALLAVGPGWLRARPERGAPIQARWQQWLRMRPDGDGHVVSLAGGAEVAVDGQGRLGAGEMHLWLDVLAAPPEGAGSRTDARPSPGVGPDLSRVRPSRMLARGTVDALAGPVTARTERLEVWFRTVAEAAAGAGAADAPAMPGATGARPAADAMRLTATAALVRGLVHMSPGGTHLEEVSMEGQVRLVEQNADGVAPPAAAAAEGLEILGEQLQLSRAARFDARAVIAGRPARVRGRGIDLEGPLVDFDRGRGRLLVDGAGRLRLPPMATSGGLGGLGFTGPPAQPPAAAAAPAEPLDVTWQGRMDFDGLTARFTDRVEAANADASLRAGLLDVAFDRPFEFTGDGPRRGGPQPQVARVSCGNGVRVESRTTAADGHRSQERLFARDLVIDRVTGDVTGTGPGRLTSTRYGEAPVLAVATAAPAPAAGPTPATRPPGLTYLGVDFQRGLRGNLHRRSLEFHQRVEAIWGPIDVWEATLDPHAPGGPPANAVVVSCDSLGIGQMQASSSATRPSMELAAGGNVLVEGESFTARSARLTWSEAKDLLVFEGDGRSDARLFRQTRPGAAPSSASAGKILYWRALERVEVEDARFLDLDQLRGGPNPGLPGPRQAPPRTPAAALPAT